MPSFLTYAIPKKILGSFLGGGGMIVVVIFRIINNSVVVYIYRDKRTGIVLQNNCIVYVYMTSYGLIYASIGLSLFYQIPQYFRNCVQKK